MSLFALLCRAHHRPRGSIRIWPSLLKQRSILGGARLISSQSVSHRDASVRDLRNIGIVAHIDAVWTFGKFTEI